MIISSLLRNVESLCSKYDEIVGTLQTLSLCSPFRKVNSHKFIENIIKTVPFCMRCQATQSRSSWETFSSFPAWRSCLPLCLWPIFSSAIAVFSGRGDAVSTNECLLVVAVLSGAFWKVFWNAWKSSFPSAGRTVHLLLRILRRKIRSALLIRV